MNKHISLTRIREIFPDFNVTPISEAELWRVLKKNKIILRYMPLERLGVDGYHERYNGRNYILIGDHLSGLKWMHTVLHELCHFIFDVPMNRKNYKFFRHREGNIDDPRERWADAFATICLMPWPELIRLSKEEPPEDLETLRLCMDRLAVKRDYWM